MYDITVTAIDGRSMPLSAYRGHVLLVVNVASRCGFTPQYAGLEALHRKHKDRRFAVLGFPCNQFGGQEPGGDEEIQRFCIERYDITFPLFSKIEVNGPSAHPLFRHLTAARRGAFGLRRISWNFTKFLIDRQGAVIRRSGPRTTPEALDPDILRLTGESPLS